VGFPSSSAAVEGDAAVLRAAGARPAPVQLLLQRSRCRLQDPRQPLITTALHMRIILMIIILIIICACCRIPDAHLLLLLLLLLLPPPPLPPTKRSSSSMASPAAAGSWFKSTCIIIAIAIAITGEWEGIDEIDVNR
jgi:hypothetical protein